MVGPLGSVRGARLGSRMAAPGSLLTRARRARARLGQNEITVPHWRVPQVLGTPRSHVMSLGDAKYYQMKPGSKYCPSGPVIKYCNCPNPYRSQYLTEQGNKGVIGKLLERATPPSLSCSLIPTSQSDIEQRPLPPQAHTTWIGSNWMDLSWVQLSQ